MWVWHSGDPGWVEEEGVRGTVLTSGGFEGRSRLGRIGQEEIWVLGAGMEVGGRELQVRWVGALGLSGLQQAGHLAPTPSSFPTVSSTTGSVGFPTFAGWAQVSGERGAAR